MAKQIRKVRKQEVQFRSGLLRFSVSLVVILSVGFVSLYFVKQFPLKERVLAGLPVPDAYNFEVQDVEFVFAQGLLPVFGISIGRLSLSEASCQAKRLSAHDLVFVLNPWRLIRGRVKVAWARVSHLQLDYPEACSSALTEAVLSSGGGEASETRVGADSQPVTEISSGESQLAKSAAFLPEVFTQIRRILDFEKLGYIIVDSFELQGLHPSGHVSKLAGRLSARISDKIKVDLRMNQLSIQDRSVPARKIYLETVLTDQKIHMVFESAIREGQAKAQIDIENNPGFDSKLSVDVDNVPASSLLRIAGQDFEISSLWGDCHLAVQAPWEKLKKTSLKVDGCRLQGPHGSIQLSEFEAQIGAIEKATLEVKQLNLDQLLTSKRSLYFSGVLARYGVLDGVVGYDNRRIGLQGTLSGTEFIFSNNQLRDIQRIQSLSFHFQADSKEGSGRVSDIQFESGHVLGDLQLEFQPKLSELRGKLRFHKVSLNPRVYRLMVDAEPTPFKLYGRFLYRNSKLEEWTAFMVTPELRSPWYLMKGLKIRGRGTGTEAVSRVQVESSSGNVTLNSALYEWARPTLLDNDRNQPQLNFKEFSVNLEIGKNQSLNWSRGYARVDSKRQLTSEGSLSRSGKLDGWLQWDRQDRNFMRWRYLGSYANGVWTPQSVWLRDWLSENPDFVNQNPRINFDRQSRKSLGKKINEASRKAIERFKSVLGPSKTLEVSE